MLLAYMATQRQRDTARQNIRKAQQARRGHGRRNSNQDGRAQNGQDGM